MLNKTTTYGLVRGILGTILAAALMATAVPLSASASETASAANVLSSTEALAPPLGVILATVPAKVRTTANVNLRTGSSTSHKILLTIPSGKVVPVSARSTNGWYKVAYAGRTGWVSNSYVTTSTKTPVAPRAPRLKGPNRTSRVVLTFDDCPRTLSAFTSAVNYASANNIGLVLAPTGNCLTSFKSRYGVDIAARARAKGQWVINHSISHLDLRKLSCAAAAAQLGGSGVHTNFGRPPFGAVDASVTCAYARVGMAIWTWSRDTLDWSVKSKATTVARASAAKPGDTVLMHMQWYGFEPDSLHQINKNLNKRGVKLCRAYHGTDGTGAVASTPVRLPSSLPC
ncbi:SH3 domain-containing protein [Paeniglutamicibacter kerguelensis]|uniref:Peptidoglycan/xylan/chitin deacetylase (PgdA/CDA1 family) n=1 Tax=Paeniglutamicibacter kerguelensis TaxID=254788 RepID=A0ABS4XG81_9MICC|nr:SH3 domain-containing protein [Paeniglutamicibacter kerguelensis]MBP2387477.1 peptidoglycan/xylan/chitin deacetylase (PgdA/CDA1 family) [Paeniglutamicibacter kerguelensis]